MLPKAYIPQDTEDRIYKMWEESGAFKADVESDKDPFTISMPPPNATGQLHLGHAVMLALEDIFTRFARMRGKEALWLPGTDHAAIATESVVIKKIQKEEKIADPRAAFGREKLVERIAHFVEESRGTIRSQVRKMGASCDWSRERYTFDPSLSRCVNEVFVKMHRDGLIYRGERVVNWDTALQTTISDDEIEYEDTEATLYTIEYLTAEMTGGAPVHVATSRPETKLGDSALVVHPDDERYQHLIGKVFDVDWFRGQKIKVSVIADHVVDPAFGTGVLGLTPFHSKVDYELWQRHRKSIPAYPIKVIGEDGNMTENMNGYSGMTVEECRDAFVEELRDAGLLVSEEKYTQPLSVSYRSKKPIEPLPKMQWFIDVNAKVVPWPTSAKASGGKKNKNMSLKEVMQDVVHSGEIEIVPDRFSKTYFHWIDNLQDWCVSRQIWWGHRIPVWYKRDGDQVETKVSIGSPEGKGWEQDSDTLDTWFSSGLWTWSTLIDPDLAKDTTLSLEDLLKKSPDFQKFHSTSVMETGYDILFFWVARMILMTTYATGQIPFETVYLHGLVRTRDGKKMSKSDPSTCIDPLEVISNYGADALRLSMIVGQSPGNDFRLYEEKIAGYRNFINKLWNASRFVLMQCEEAGLDPMKLANDNWQEEEKEDLGLADRALLSSLQCLVDDVTKGLEEYRLSETGERLYSFTWNFFCDWYLELSKGDSSPTVLVHTLRTIVQLLHPYCPFVTEELWDSIKPANAGKLIRHPWPSSDASLKDAKAQEQLDVVIDVVTAIRKMRAEYKVEQGKKIDVFVHTKKHFNLLEDERSQIVHLGNLSRFILDTNPQQHSNSASMFLKDVEVHLPLEGLIDVKKEYVSLTEEKKNLEKYIRGIQAKLANKDFVKRAPEEVVEGEKRKMKDSEEKLRKIESRLEMLGD